MARIARSLCWTHCLQPKQMSFPTISALLEMFMKQEPFSWSLSRYYLWPVPLTRDSLSESQEAQTQTRLEESWRGTNSRDFCSLRSKTLEVAAERELCLSKAVFISGHKSWFFKKLDKSNKQIITSKEPCLTIAFSDPARQSGSWSNREPFTLNCTASWSYKIFQPLIFCGQSPTGSTRNYKQVCSEAGVIFHIITSLTNIIKSFVPLLYDLIASLPS